MPSWSALRAAMNTRTMRASLFQRLQDMAAGLFAMMGSLFKCRKIVGAISGIRKKLQEVTDRGGRYTVDGIAAKPVVTSTIEPCLAAMYKDGTQLIGIDKSSSDLLSMMMSKGDEASKFQQQDEDSFYCRSWRIGQDYSCQSSV